MKAEPLSNVFNPQKDQIGFIRPPSWWLFSQRPKTTRDTTFVKTRIFDMREERD